MAARRVKDRSSSSFKAARGEFPLGVRGSSAARGLQVGTVSGWRRGDPCQVPAVPVPTVVPFGGHRSHSGRRPRRGVYGRFKASAGRGRRRRPGWLARSRQSAARGPAGAALLPPGASERSRRRWPRAGAQPGREPCGEEAAGRFVPFRGWRCGRRCGPFPARRAALRCARLHPGSGLRLCVASVPTTGSGVTVCSGEVTRHSDPSGAGLAAAQTDSFDCSHPGVPELPG